MTDSHVVSKIRRHKMGFELGNWELGPIIVTSIFHSFPDRIVGQCHIVTNHVVSTKYTNMDNTSTVIVTTGDQDLLVDHK